MPVAITRPVSPSIGRCELTHIAREPIDAEHAASQHRQYEMALAEAGCEIFRLPEAPEFPDGVFVEDTAVVFDEIAVMTRPGAESRRGETGSVAAVLGNYRQLAHIQAPGTLDGGDVLTVGRRVFVGVGRRSNASGAGQLQEALQPFGYEVVLVEAHDCLHLKSAVTRLGGTTLLINPDWTDPGQFAGCEFLSVDPMEPFAANALMVRDALIYPTTCPRTRKLLEGRGYKILAVDLSELARAEGAVTCCSLVV